jgi:hypothetical protein
LLVGRSSTKMMEKSSSFRPGATKNIFYFFFAK